MAGRPKLGLERVTIGLPEGLLERIDDVAGDAGRSEWIRRVLEEAVGGGGRPVVRETVAPAVVREGARVVRSVLAPVVRRVRPAGEPRFPGGVEVLACLAGGKRRTHRELEAELGWPAMRVDKVCEALSREGWVWYPGGGVVCACEGDGEVEIVDA